MVFHTQAETVGRYLKLRPEGEVRVVTIFDTHHTTTLPTLASDGVMVQGVGVTRAC